MQRKAPERRTKSGRPYRPHGVKFIECVGSGKGYHGLGGRCWWCGQYVYTTYRNGKRVAQKHANIRETRRRMR